MTLLPLQKFLVTNKVFINRTFLAIEISLLLIWLVGAYLLFTSVDYILGIYELGRRFGQVAICFYMLSLIPGIMSRLRLQPMMGAMLMMFRRHFGIIMFLSAFTHMGFTTTLPAFSVGLLPVLMTPQLLGLGALLALFPMWLTSNDTSQRYLGKNWKRLHKLTYVALLLIFGHVALMQKNWMYLMGPLLILEVISWLVFWQRTKYAILSDST